MESTQSSAIEYDVSECWKSPEEALQELNSLCELGDNRDDSFVVTSCFKVWGRGRPRTPIHEIVLPGLTANSCPSTLHSSQSSSNEDKIHLPRSKGRGHLLLLDDFPLEVEDFKAKQHLKKKSSNNRKSLAANVEGKFYRQTQRKIQDKLNHEKQLADSKMLFDIDKDFPLLH